MDFTIGLILGAIATAAIGWTVAHLMPGIWANLVQTPSVRIHVEVDPGNIYAGAPNWVGSTWVLPSDIDPGELGNPPTTTCHDWRQWLWGLGAYDAYYTELRVTLQGNVDTTVLVDGLRTMIIEQGQPQGHLFVCPVGGADITPRAVEIDLDWNGVVTYHDEDGPATRFTFTLARGEVEVFHIRATATQRCTWTAELLLIVDGKRQTLYLDADGEPFRTSGVEGLPAWTWRSGDQWDQGWPPGEAASWSVPCPSVRTALQKGRRRWVESAP